MGRDIDVRGVVPELVGLAGGRLNDRGAARERTDDHEPRKS
jgi:hypothetical protein